MKFQMKRHFIRDSTDCLDKIDLQRNKYNASFVTIPCNHSLYAMTILTSLYSTLVKNPLVLKGLTNCFSVSSYIQLYTPQYDEVIIYFQEWVDEFMRWDPEKFSNITMLRIPCHKLWLPDMVLYNKYVTKTLYSKHFTNIAHIVYVSAWQVKQKF